MPAVKNGRFSADLNEVLFDAILVDVAGIRARALRRLGRWSEAIGRNRGNVET